MPTAKYGRNILDIGEQASESSGWGLMKNDIGGYLPTVGRFDIGGYSKPEFKVILDKVSFNKYFMIKNVYLLFINNYCPIFVIST